MNRYFIPLLLFFCIAVFLYLGLGLKPNLVPSPLINKPAPPFVLTQLHDPQQTIRPEDMKGKVWLLNVWASWCRACLQEHPYLLAASEQLAIVGLNYKDEEQAAKDWLQKWQNPYYKIAVDADGKTGLDWGVYGVPETFVIDKLGVIRHKFIGPIHQQDMEEIILPLVKQLEGEI